MTSFTELGLIAPLTAALQQEGYTSPTPIQHQAIPQVLAGRDLLGIAQTGTGKTAAFALPILQRLAENNQRPERGTCRALILSPTRELASQIAESFEAYGRNLKLSVAVVFGGVSARPQSDKIARGVDILVATPGRLLDHMDSGILRIGALQVFVLDEADQMLDMGFIHAIRRIVRKLPAVRQNLFFSATMPRDIATLAGDLLRDPVKVAVAPVATTAERVDQRVIFIETAKKRALLTEILREPDMSRTLVFARTKHGADRVVKHLEASGLAAAAIHGNKSQNQRERALEAFKSGDMPVLVATDIAARGIDVEAVSHVVNFDLPNVAESYVHRIGRTARAGAAGQAISFCDAEERPFLKDIETLIRQKIPASDRRGDAALEAVAVSKADGVRPQGARPVGAQGRGHGQGGGRGQPSGRPAQRQGGHRDGGQGREDGRHKAGPVPQGRSSKANGSGGHAHVGGRGGNAGGERRSAGQPSGGLPGFLSRPASRGNRRPGGSR